MSFTVEKTIGNNVESGIVTGWCHSLYLIKGTTSQKGMHKHRRIWNRMKRYILCLRSFESEVGSLSREKLRAKNQCNNFKSFLCRWNYILCGLLLHSFRQEASGEESVRKFCEFPFGFEKYSGYPPIGNITGGATPRTKHSKSEILSECYDEISSSDESEMDFISDGSVDASVTNVWESTPSRPPPPLPEYETQKLALSSRDDTFLNSRSSFYPEKSNQIAEEGSGGGIPAQHDDVNQFLKPDNQDSIRKRIFKRLYDPARAKKLGDKDERRDNSKRKGTDENLMESKGTKARPVVYRYFGRRSRRSYSIPFILLGPNVDQWKETGKVLASRGFNAIACEWSAVEEVDETMKQKRHIKSCDKSTGREDEGLVLAVLDALRWERAIIVGCDSFAVTAMEAARKLAPERVAGLIMCGDLTQAEKYLTMTRKRVENAQKAALVERYSSSWNYPSPLSNFLLDDFRSIDHYVQKQISCPSIIIWDGDLSALRLPFSESDDAKVIVPEIRSIILGGGNAPHRRLPEQFAWVLTRFFEEKIVINDEIKTAIELSRNEHLPSAVEKSNETSKVFSFWNSAWLRQLCSAESALLSGNVAANAIVYILACHVALYQCKNIVKFCGLFRYNCVRLSIWKRKVLQFMNEIIFDDLQRKIFPLRYFKKKHYNNTI